MKAIPGGWPSASVGRQRQVLIGSAQISVNPVDAEHLAVVLLQQLPAIADLHFDVILHPTQPLLDVN